MPMNELGSACLALLLVLSLETRAAADEGTCETVCLRSGDGESVGGWLEGETLSAKARAKEAKKQRKAKEVGVRVELEGGRGSVFIDGRYLASGDEGRAVKPGKHELEVRDGERVIALGVIQIPSKIGEVVIQVKVDE